jgi:precorrin-3B C17-methyltransferase
MTAIQGRIFVVGIGPGRLDLLTPQAAAAIRQADVVIAYGGYLTMIADLIQGKEILSLPLGQERERAQAALLQTGQGRHVAVISSGDPGIYAMASVVLDMLASMPAEKWPDIEVIPGVSALNAAAALLGAPLGHDFAAISLSDLLTPWPIIEKRLQAVADADFVLALFNPKSQRRDWQLGRAREILLSRRAGSTPLGIVHNAYRPGQEVELTTLSDMNIANVDMFTILFVGNSTTRSLGRFFWTPRGY